jgi:hypothetical protein
VGFPAALPLELEGRFYCGSCGGLFEGLRADLAKNMWSTTGRINNEIMGIVEQQRVIERERRTRKGRSKLAQKRRGRD